MGLHPVLNLFLELALLAHHLGNPNQPLQQQQQIHAWLLEKHVLVLPLVLLENVVKGLHPVLNLFLKLALLAHHLHDQNQLLLQQLQNTNGYTINLEILYDQRK